VARVDFARRLARNALLWIVPAALVWLALSPVYNRFLAAAGEALLHLGESPNATRLYVRDLHVLRVARTDIGGGQSALDETRLSDFHFDWILLATLFLATPGITLSQRARTLAWSAGALVLFHLLLLVCHVESLYANGLGDWSLRHYGAVARNAWGLGKHLLDLPFKFALPFALWAGFHLRLLRAPAPPPPRPQRKRKGSAEPSA
jgi:hypothetical protein